MSWKKNIRKIPQAIRIKLSTIKEREVIVGCIKKFSRNAIEEGVLSHLGINIIEHELRYTKIFLPRPDQGKHSNWNINGREIVRKNLPKEKFYNYVEAPNWGDSYYGTHTVALPGERYPRDFIAPRFSTIEIDFVNESIDQEHFIIKFQISEVLNRDSDIFKDRLLDCLNILQENIGNCGVEKANITLHDYIQSLYVSWDILPPGTIDEVHDRLFTTRSPSIQEKETTDDRYNFFMSLNPQNLIYGKSGFNRYFGAKIREDLVVFENVKYGNAIYIMQNNWQDLCQKSRVDLLSGKFGDNFERVIHMKNWKHKVRSIIEA